MTQEETKKVEHVRHLHEHLDHLNTCIRYYEIDPDDHQDALNERLDELYPPLFNIRPSEILKTCDPIGYREELLNFVDQLELEDDPAYRELLEERNELERELKATEAGETT